MELLKIHFLQKNVAEAVYGYILRIIELKRCYVRRKKRTRKLWSSMKMTEWEAWMRSYISGSLTRQVLQILDLNAEGYSHQTAYKAMPARKYKPEGQIK